MLNEVFTGGLSSYSIVNMVMTHLLCMGFQLPDLPGPVGDGPGFWGSLVPAPEFPEKDVGELLLSFFDHFGSSFNYVLNAVSVGQVSHLFVCSWAGASTPHCVKERSYRQRTLLSNSALVFMPSCSVEIQGVNIKQLCNSAQGALFQQLFDIHTVDLHTTQTCMLTAKGQGFLKIEACISSLSAAV